MSPRFSRRKTTRVADVLPELKRHDRVPGDSTMFGKSKPSSTESQTSAWKLFLNVAKPYWKSDVKWQAFGLLGILIALLASVNALNVVINYVGGAWMTAYSGKDVPTFYRMTAYYFSVFVVGTPIVVFYSWMADKLGLHWRSWLTPHILDKYLANRNYYRINNDPYIDNPDERISDDVKSFTRTSLSLGLAFLGSIITLCSFITILVSISHELVGIVFGYTLIGTIVTIWLGRRLVGLKFNQLKKEANFRYNLIHVRNNVESIAFYQGEDEEKRSV
ncbi:MAG: SbmA/BacA-like family transporter, partial [Terriglobales bacterium]